MSYGRAKHEAFIAKMESKMECDHFWAYMQTRYKLIFYGEEKSYFRIDEFFCHKCLAMTEKRKEQNGNEPEWFEMGKAEVIARGD